ncbi:hypothetical protein A3768_4598 (plasmid) [Ralstonia solanacearum]|nr:hypothetical protein A3768_4598 [Ralstonia solanacearum]
MADFRITIAPAMPGWTMSTLRRSVAMAAW